MDSRERSVVKAVFADVDRANTGVGGRFGRRTEPAPPPPPPPPPPVTRVELNMVIDRVAMLQDRVDKLAALMIGPVKEATLKGKVAPRDYYHDPVDDREMMAEDMFRLYGGSLRRSSEGVDRLDVW